MLHAWKSESVLDSLGAFQMARENLWEKSGLGFFCLGLIRFFAQVVLITASGLLGDQPLVNRSNVDKGSRQNRSVTSGKGLALKVARGCV